jgi:Fe-S cluster assembly protein SufD
MTTLTDSKQVPISKEGFLAFLDSRREPDWVTDQRRSAWQLFERMRWPSQRDEEWMRTDIRLFHVERFQLLRSAKAAQPMTGVMSEGIELAGSLSAVDGVPADYVTLQEKWKSQGVLFGSLGQMILEHGEFIRKYLFQAVDPSKDRFAALHQAVWSGGLFLYVPRNVSIELPIHHMTYMSEGGTDTCHTLLILDEGAEATVLSETASLPESTGLHVGAIEIFVGDRANLRYVNFQDWGQQVWHFAHQKAVLGADASLQWTVAALGSRLAKVNQHVALAGAGARSQVNGVLFTENRQHLSYHTMQHHQQPACTSDFLYKAALQDMSRTVWRGMIKVDPGAQRTDGYQRNDNLLLSPKARADSIPGLEIEADDVRCTHGSTSGRVDEELIFYAQSRGFTRKEAIRMVVTGFFQQIFDRITIPSVRDALSLAIARRVREYA